MKNILYTIGLIFCSIFSVNAQEYESCFGTESTQWVIAEPTSVGAGAGTITPNYYVFDSIQCYGWYYENFNDNVLYFETEGNSQLKRWNMGTNETKIIMDLNWGVGDTVIIENNNTDFTLYYDRTYAIVDSVYLDMFNRKVILTDFIFQIDTNYFKLKYIEGVGPNASIFLLENYEFFWGSASFLLCSYKNGELCYTNTEISGDCTYPNGYVSNPIIEQANDIKFNSHQNTISLSLEEDFTGILKLITSNGEVVRTFKVNNCVHNINIEDIADGIYIVQLSNLFDNYYQSKKIIKTKI